MDSHPHASEVSTPSNQNSGAEASFDQGSTKTPVCADGTKHRSPLMKQHSQLSMSSFDDPIELDSERDSPVGGRSHGLNHGHNDHCHVVGEDHSLRRLTMAVEHNESLRSLPSGNYQPSDDMSDYVTMAPVKSLSTPLRNGMIPPRNGVTTLPYQSYSRLCPQTQNSVIKGMKATNVYDQVINDNPTSIYENVPMKTSH